MTCLEAFLETVLVAQAMKDEDPTRKITATLTIKFEDDEADEADLASLEEVPTEAGASLKVTSLDDMCASVRASDCVVVIDPEDGRDPRRAFFLAGYARSRGIPVHCVGPTALGALRRRTMQ